jgi:hypothetical protein
MFKSQVYLTSLFGLIGVTLLGGVCATTVTNDTSVAANKTFDYVIAGAGLSGIVVGNKVLTSTNIAEPKIR